jgi:hypothetical protein
LGVNLSKIDIPAGWEQIDLGRLKGTLLEVGAPDMGKSTLLQYLFQRLQLGSLIGFDLL